MHNLPRVLATAAIAAVAFSGTAFADTTTHTYQTSLSGTNEVPQAASSTPATSTTANTDLIISLYQKLIPLLTQRLALLQQQKGIMH